MAITDEQYNHLAEQSYWVDSGKSDVPYRPKERKTYYYDTENESLGQFQVLKTEDNLSNGMQAMAVAPVDKSGNVDISEIVIA